MSFFNAPMYDWSAVCKEGRSSLIRRWKNDPDFSKALVRDLSVSWERLSKYSEGEWTTEDQSLNDAMFYLGTILGPLR